MKSKEKYSRIETATLTILLNNDAHLSKISKIIKIKLRSHIKNIINESFFSQYITTKQQGKKVIYSIDKMKFYESLIGFFDIYPWIKENETNSAERKSFFFNMLDLFFKNELEKMNKNKTIEFTLENFPDAFLLFLINIRQKTETPKNLSKKFNENLNRLIHRFSYSFSLQKPISQNILEQIETKLISN